MVNIQRRIIMQKAVRVHTYQVVMCERARSQELRSIYQTLDASNGTHFL